MKNLLEWWGSLPFLSTDFLENLSTVVFAHTQFIQVNYEGSIRSALMVSRDTAGMDAGDGPMGSGMDKTGALRQDPLLAQRGQSEEE